MDRTPDWQKERVLTYFRETTEASYLANWSGTALSFHFGLSDETTQSLDEAHVAANAYVADALAIHAGARVLDAGCGVGGTSIWLAQNRGAAVHGITLDPKQVELGTRFAEERGVADRVTLSVMDFAATTFAPASFDAALNIESLCHAVDAAGYLAHVRTLLCDGGRYGALEFFVGDGRSDLVDVVRDGWAMPTWQTMGSVSDALRAAGFVDVEAVDLTPRVARSAEQMRAMADNSLQMLRLRRAMTNEESPVYEGHVRAALACCEGLLGGGITYGFVRGRRAG